jgi:hypothetical protein
MYAHVSVQSQLVPLKVSLLRQTRMISLKSTEMSLASSSSASSPLSP